MFTGIVECTGKVIDLKRDKSNVHITVESPISAALKPDQSVNHNGVCLTVVLVKDGAHTITAVDETLQRSNLNSLKVGDLVNLERAMILNGRLDGHMVQGHVDDTAECVAIEDQKGSWLYTFKFKSTQQSLLVEKGSICINGVSLTVFNIKRDSFSVAIIPYTYEHTNFNKLLNGQLVNIEFDVIGKYVAKWMEVFQYPAKNK